MIATLINFFKSPIRRLQDDIAAWSDPTFGYDRHPESTLRHIQEEIEELLAAPYDLMEYADVMHMLLDCSRRAGFDADMLLDATRRKLEINKKRKWGKPNDQGYSKHIE